MNLKLTFETLKWIHLLTLIGTLVLVGCEMSRTVPLEPPDYKPQLMIHCLAGPLSGAQADIRYNKPLREEDNNLIPSLPPMEVWLLKNGERSQAFTQDSIGRFSIAADNLSLEPGNSYAMEVVDLTNNETYTSGSSLLPIQPKIGSATAKRDSDFVDNYALEILLEGVNEPVEAISVFPVLLDSLGLPAKKISGGNIQKLTPWRKVRSRVQYTNDETWTAKELLFRLRAGYLDDEGNYYPAKQVNVYVMYLSDDQARFIRDLEESYFSGEDIFQIVRPVYSNFQKASGIFGLYNEVRLELEIEE